MRAVGLDLDGTLFDHRGSAIAGVNAFFRSLGVESTESIQGMNAALVDRYGVGSPGLEAVLRMALG
jgi:putative hydrolase of the HAD superfamily